jgi:hypothetical protein
LGTGGGQGHAITIMPTKHKPITVTLNATNIVNALIEIYDYLVEHPHLKLDSLHIVSFHMPGKTKWKVRFTQKD